MLNEEVSDFHSKEGLCKMQIKTTMTYHLTSVRMAVIKKTRKISIGKDVEKREPLCTW